MPEPLSDWIDKAGIGSLKKPDRFPFDMARGIENRHHDDPALDFCFRELSRIIEARSHKKRGFLLRVAAIARES